MNISSNKIMVITILLATMTQAQATPSPLPQDGPPPRPSFSSLDINSDGDISFDEFSTQKLPRGDHKTIFSTIDKDRNNVLSEEEFMGHKPSKKKGMK
jgi:hypothetical protein